MKNFCTSFIQQQPSYGEKKAGRLKGKLGIICWMPSDLKMYNKRASQHTGDLAMDKTTD